MTWLKRYSIHCSNKRCFASVTCPPEVRSLAVARRHVAQQGWTFQRPWPGQAAEDRCPKHPFESAS